MADDLLSALDPEQRMVAEALRGPVRVLAGAGTGKTRAITHRIAHGVATGVYQPTEVLAVTFTTRAAGEMRTRLRQLGAPGVQARTFHSAALRQLRYFWPTVHGTELPELTESKLPLMALAARRQRLDVDQPMLRDLASEVEWAKVSNVRPEDYATLAPRRSREVNGVDHATVARVFGAYEDVKRSQGRMDMEDVLLLTAALLATDERVAAQVRRQYKFFTVDEFQDVSPIQSALLDLWLGGRDEICVVGDPAQTIYSFAGANADYLREFPAQRPGTTSIELVRNYRSSPEIIGAANHLLAGTRSSGVQLRAQRPSGSRVDYVEHADEVAEAEAVATRIAELQAAGLPLREMAVLFRINAQSEAFEDALTARGIAYVVRGAARFFDRAEVRQAITLLRGTARSSGGTGALVDDVRATLAGMGWADEPPSGRGTARDRWESLQALASQAEAFAAADGAATLGDFVGDLDKRAAEQHAPVAEGVTLATLHTAKGLEWDAVFVCGVQEGSIPISFAQTPAEVEEERRLLYVGVTRARVHLRVSWSLARNPGGRATRRASRFLHGLRPESAAAPTGTSRKSKRAARSAMCSICGKPLATAGEKKVGRCADCPAAYDEELFARLKEWRRVRASEDEVPAYVVFTDKTLEAIAEAKPRNPTALLRISGVGPAKIERYGEAVLELID
ncbi:ATP-dependent DNA helicase UvrD2 [Nocardioides sp. AE5]|uniref:ATP-dependent DNA helicase UvrD2 n=1 Tax=Nocardioides sp. AE5 TaxID=2962573 RepID=UPI002882A3D4|nr:ATP-dependent DNA helicase UvrD2 [Nocardioides sp. AE5]MDT0203944.1 ATP-dependent DNA helicase UvrD2 [Nocardioides sp. AE5]